MGFTVDFDATTAFPPVDPGKYDAVIHSANPEQGKQGTYLKIRFSLIADEMNRQVWHNLSLATGAQWKVNKTLTDLGLAKGENTFKSRAEYELAVQAMLTGAECSITVENEDYEGSVQDRVVKIEARS